MKTNTQAPGAWAQQQKLGEQKKEKKQDQANSVAEQAPPKPSDDPVTPEDQGGIAGP